MENSRNNIAVLIKSVFYVNNFTASQVLNTQCENIHIKSRLHQHYNFHGPTLCMFYKQSNLFDSLSNSVYKKGKSIRVCQLLFFTKFICFYWLFWFQFSFYLFTFDFSFDLILVSISFLLQFIFQFQFGFSFYFLGPGAIFFCKVNQ